MRWVAAVTIIVLVAAEAAALITRGRTEQAAQPAVPAVESWSPGGHITGSVYDGGAYGTLPPITNPPLGIEPLDAQNVERLPRGLTDYFRR